MFMFAPQASHGLARPSRSRGRQMRKQPNEEPAADHTANDRVAEPASTIPLEREDSSRKTRSVKERDRPHPRVRTIAAATSERAGGFEDPWVEAESRDVPDDALVTSRQVRERVGSVSAMCLWRWRRDGKFPAPVKINGRNYWRIGVIRAWSMAQGDETRPRGNDVDRERTAAVRATSCKVGGGCK